MLISSEHHAFEPMFLATLALQTGSHVCVKLCTATAIATADELTLYRLTVCVERISELYRPPVLEQQLWSFPLGVQSFPSSNGSRVRNLPRGRAAGETALGGFHQVASAADRDSDRTGSKRGGLIRKQFGYGDSTGQQADRLNRFHREDPLRPGTTARGDPGVLDSVSGSTPPSVPPCPAESSYRPPPGRNQGRPIR